MSSAIASAADAMQLAFLRSDFSFAADTLADDVVLNSPVLERPWRTKAVVERLGPAMVSLFEDIEFAPVIAQGDRAVISFKARRGSVDVQLIQVLDVGHTGTVGELTIYIRPLPALLAVAKAMQARVDPDLLAAHSS
jgi:hypothetical protein